MQLIKSLRSFCRWLFNIKDEVKQEQVQINRFDVFSERNDDESIVYVQSNYDDVITYRFHGECTTCKARTHDFLSLYRKRS